MMGISANYGGANMERRYSFLYILIGSVVVFCLLVVGNGRLRGQIGGAAAAPVTDPNSYIFRLELGGTVVAEYTACSGLGSGNDIMENTVAADVLAPDALGTVIQKTAGALRWPNIVLRRKGLHNDGVWSWRKAMETGDTKGAFREGAIVVVAVPTDQFLMRWSFRQGWVASLTFDGQMEELVIVHQGLGYTTTSTAPPRATRS
jgi:hypothetical protein